MGAKGAMDEVDLVVSGHPDTLRLGAPSAGFAAAVARPAVVHPKAVARPEAVVVAAVAAMKLPERGAEGARPLTK